MNLMRPFVSSDLNACLQLFDSNTPAFFDPLERPDFLNFLEHSPRNLLVIERDGRIVACGGHALRAGTSTASLCWGMVDQTLHGQGLGRLLTEARLLAIREQGLASTVRLSTSQHSQGFYAGLGFVLLEVTPDGHGPGLDCWDMQLSLS
ncbi:MAG: GNAT family N-acetyltransferase [Pseudomonas sp.]|uniref:GNAT family N-acetyltransferase n=1 Tax=unclassified Pseudomonas TaxID=196821 RepID=UPI001CFA1C7A|nr:GNAT family N-acetyltransferase [Pseudomonas sp. L5B5]UCZ85379.1 GNAT family N-acetyltransferase [Pseudomonas sp. L5B5]